MEPSIVGDLFHSLKLTEWESNVMEGMRRSSNDPNLSLSAKVITSNGENYKGLWAWLLSSWG